MPILLTDGTGAVKWIDYTIPTPGSHTQKLRLGFTTKETNGYSPVAMTLIGSLYGGKTSCVSLARAEEIRSSLSARFGEVRLVTRLTIPSTAEDHFFATDAAGNRVLKAGVSRDAVEEPVALEFTDLSRAREIAQYCQESLGILSIEDRAALSHAYLPDLDKALLCHSLLAPTINPAQRDILRMLVEPYIDDLIEGCDTAENGDALTGHSTWLSADAAFASLPKREIALAVLLHSVQRDAGTVFYEWLVSLKPKCESGKFLNELYEGTLPIEMEEALRKTGTSIPDLKTRRQIVLELIREKIAAKYGEASTEDVDGIKRSLIDAFRDRLFVNGCRLNTLKLGERPSPSAAGSAVDTRTPLLVSSIYTAVTAILNPSSSADSLIWYEDGSPLTSEEIIERIALYLGELDCPTEPMAEAGGAGAGAGAGAS